MLTGIISGREISSLVLIEDHAEVPGVSLLKAFVTSLSTRVDMVHLVLLEAPEEKFLQGLLPNVTRKLKVHTVGRDPLGWNDSRPTMDDDLKSLIQPAEQQHQSVAVVMDSITNLVLHRGPAYTCQTLHQLPRQQPNSGKNSCHVEQVVALVHRDLHDDSTLSALRHTVSSVIGCTVPQPNTAFFGGCHVIHKKLSGKVTKVKEHYNLSRNFEVTECEDMRLEIEARPGSSTVDAINEFAAGLTFNIKISEKEKEDRSKVPLPYIRDRTREEAAVSRAGGGKIFYQPDEADQFDEDDPDDDLDI